MQETFGFETQTMHTPANFVFKLNYFSPGEMGNKDQTLDTWIIRLWCQVNDLKKVSKRSSQKYGITNL